MRFDKESLIDVKSVVEASYGLQIELAGLYAMRRGDIPIWYRGTSKTSHFPIPSLGRDGYSLEHERPLINGFKQNALQFTEPRPTDEWEWLFLLRHHSVPTRLLDWTESPIVALYFAALQGKDAPGDGAIWVLYPTLLNRIAGIKTSFEGDLPLFAESDQDTKPYTPSEVNDGEERGPIAGIAPRQTRRMVAQQSVFTVTHRTLTSLEAVGTGEHIGRFIIPEEQKERIRDELGAIMFSSYTLFPELDSVGALARRRFDG